MVRRPAALPNGRTWPLLGRSDALEEVLADLATGGGVLLVGEAGVGKSRLAMEAIGAAAEDGAATAHFTATASAATIPLGALTGALPPGAHGAGAALLRAVGSTLTARAQGRPLVLLVDDMHLLDAVSATVIDQLVRSRRARLVGTARSRARLPDAVLSLWKDEQISRRDLGPLRDSDIEHLAEHLLGSPLTITAQLRLVRLCQGNPLFLRELVADAVAQGSLRRDGVSWQWHGPPVALPRLADLVRIRLERVDRHERDLLEMLALSEPLPLAAATRLADRACVEQLEESLLLVTEGQPALVRLSHPLYAEVLRRDLPGSRRSDHYRRLVEATSDVRCADVRDDGGSSSEGMANLQRAIWMVEGGLPGDPLTFTEAAGCALDRFDVDLAERLARAAGPGLPNAALTLGSALLAQGRRSDAEHVLHPLLASPSPEMRARTAAILASSVAHGPGGLAQAMQVLDPVAASLNDSVWAMRLLAERAEILVDLGALEAAGRAALTLSGDSESDPEMWLRALWALQGTLSLTGCQDDAVAIGARLDLPDAIVGHPPGLVRRMMTSHGMALLNAGRLSDAVQLADAGLREAIDTEDSRTHALWAVQRGWCLLRQGRPRTAHASLTEAVSLLTVRDPHGVLSLARALRLQSGVIVGVAAETAEAQPLPGADHVMDPIRDGALTWGLVAQGQISQARAALGRAAADAALRGAVSLQADLLHDVLRIGGDVVVARQLSTVCAPQQGQWARAYEAHAQARVRGSGTAYLAAAAAFEEMGAQLDAAEMATAASKAFAQAGLRSSARSAGSRSAVLRQSCEGARTPLLEQSETTARLTAREQEIAGLAQRGRTNAQIAAALTVSVRTVEGHLCRAYAKLGIADRHELTAVLTAAPRARAD